MLSRDDLQSIIASGNWDTLVGEVEGDFLECKSAPYQLETDEKKVELAKDITSLANSSGGYIILGVRTRRSEQHFSDQIMTLRPFRQELCDPNRYLQIANDWIYPAIQGLSVCWKPCSEGEPDGFVIIDVPEQTRGKNLFLITKTLLEDKLSYVMFGYAQRQQDSSRPFSINELYQALRDGMHYDEVVGKRFDALEARLEVADQPMHTEGWQSEPEERVDRLVRDPNMNMPHTRHVFVVAYPSVPKQLSTFFDTRNGINQLMADPPVVRPNGFDVAVANVQLKRGVLWQGSSGGKLLEVHRDGMAILLTTADEHWLCWTTNDVINTLALVETVYSFAIFYGEIIASLDPVPDEIIIDWRIDCVDQPVLKLNPNRMGDAFRLRSHLTVEAPEPRVDRKIRVNVTDYEPAKVAYRIVQEIFAWFETPPDHIPYADDDLQAILPDTFGH